MQLPYSDELNIEYLGRLFDNTSECYKFFWFKAILAKVTAGELRMTYEELVDEMIADAWYMVTEYHLNLGPKDTLEALVRYIKEHSALKSSEKRAVILSYLAETQDVEIIKRKRTLVLNVPYRLQSPFLSSLKGAEWNTSVKQIAEKINLEPRLIYYFSEINGLSTEIIMQEDWAEYIIKNQEIIRGWLEYNMIRYLQRRNPNVPGIADKLYPPLERKLEKVKKYWKLVASIDKIIEIYDGRVITNDDISIDHFIPWSYVAHDEMWNLSPTTKNINSAKSNNLPDWDVYFGRLAKLEYQSYSLIWKSDKVHDEFDKCAKEHINSDEIRHRIYRQGLDFDIFSKELESVILPVYKSAQNCGFISWQYKGA